VLCQQFVSNGDFVPTVLYGAFLKNPECGPAARPAACVVLMVLGTFYDLRGGGDSCSSAIRFFTVY